MLELILITRLLFSGSPDIPLKDIVKLPPRPDQSIIECKDVAWENETLTLTKNKRVHSKLAPFISQAIDEATTNGYQLQITSAYRTCAEQGRLRATACGIGDYNLYQKPIDLCLPPTEPAGRSLHNEGLAVDFACRGYGFFQSSPCYAWLKQNSERFQLREHRLEPWHWSTTGK